MRGKYNAIYADPPWEQKGGRPLKGYLRNGDKQLFVPSSNTSADLPYNTMSLDEICALPVAEELAADDAHLYLWVTNKYLFKAEQVINAWGFKYSTCLTWDKKPLGGGLGGAFGISQEFLLFCRRGSLKAKKRISQSVFSIKRPYENGHPVHSRKPEFFAELITEVSPGPYVELFARRERARWEVWGNEVSNSIVFPSYAALL